MAEIDTLRPLIQACLTNAASLLDSAKELSKPGRKHIAYHLAALALEEIGKASMLVTRLVSPLREDGDSEDEDQISPKWIEDHERKLFWALWTPSIAAGKLTGKFIQELQALARQIHERRLASLYVEVNAAAEVHVEVSDHDLQALISATETRLGMEKLASLRALDTTGKQAVDWFLNAYEDPQLRSVILGAESLSKLAELAGDSKGWIQWLRGRMDEIDANNKELLRKELEKSTQDHSASQEPKWRLKLRFHTTSHKILQKHLSDWNNKSEWIKLFATHNKQELIAQFTLTSEVPLQAIWQAGLQISTMFLIALNIATLGFFWWYVPTFVARYYEELFDLENRAPLVAERDPPLRLPIKREALKNRQLLNAGLVFVHLTSASANHQAAYGRYNRGLSLLAKNDIFGQFEANALVEFYEAFRAGLNAYGDWNGDPETFSAAVEAVLQGFWTKSEIAVDVAALVENAASISSQKRSAKPVTLDDVLKMKACCDLYFFFSARRVVAERAKETLSAKPPTG
jgi:AbiV family abortive infection protein